MGKVDLAMREARSVFSNSESPEPRQVIHLPKGWLILAGEGTGENLYIQTDINAYAFRQGCQHNKVK